MVTRSWPRTPGDGGKSEGQWEAFVHDAADSHNVIEWAAAQPWCTGMVGTTGLSYMGWVQWAAASQHPPHLRAMISTSAAGRWQQEIPYTNGVFQLYFGWWAFSTRRRILESQRVEQADWEQILRTLPFGSIGEFIDGAGQTWDTICGHETLDEFWQALRYDGDHGTIDVPCLHGTGWYDLEDLLGAFHHYEHMRGLSSQRLAVPAGWPVEPREIPVPRRGMRRSRLRPGGRARHGRRAPALVRPLAEGDGPGPGRPGPRRAAASWAGPPPANTVSSRSALSCRARSAESR